MMRAETHEQLARSIEVLISGDGSLSMRLFCAAAALTSITPDAFTDHRLRGQFRALWDDLVMMGVIPMDPEPPVIDYEPKAAMTMAMRLLDVGFGVATSEAEYD